MKLIKNKLITIYIIINMFYILIGNYLVFNNTIEYSLFGKSIVIAFIMNAIVSVILFIYYRYIKKVYKIGIFDIFIVLLTTFSLVSVIYAVNNKVALYGHTMRYEGLFALLYYYSLFYLTRFINKSNKIIPIFIILFGLYESVYAILQFYDSPLVTISYTMFGYKVIFGTLVNPNFYSTFILLALSYAIGLFIDIKNKIINVLLYLIITVLFIGLLIGNTTSTIVGLACLFPILLFWCIKHKKTLKLILLIITLVSILFIGAHYKLTTLVRDIGQTRNEVVELSKGNYNKSFGTSRLGIWENTIPIIPKYLLHGAGIDNYYYAFGNKPLIVNNVRYDKAHNEYLQILVTEGIFKLLTYLLLIIIIIKRYNKKEIYFILPVIGYIVQAFFNISVIEVAPFFYIALGLCISDYSINYNKKFYLKYTKNIIDYILAIILLIILSPIILISMLLIILIDHNKPIYKQLRSGRNNKEFNIYKLTTIKNNKVTKLGRILRTLSIDELPQLINIIKGEMSFIGPRPWITEYSKYFNKNQIRRLEVKPGIIGLAQVNGRNNINVFDKINNDIKYVDNVSLLVDLMIFIKSIDSIFNKEKEHDMNQYISKELKLLKNQ